MSGKMAAIVGYILGEHWTEPEVAELVITSDGLVLARERGDCGCNTIIGSAQDLERNVSNLLYAATLTPEERQQWEALYRLRVTDWRNGR
jgi:urease accessory protein UreF